MTLKISPTGDTSAFRLEIFEWSNAEQKDIRMGDFYIYSKNGELVITGMKDWRTNHKDPIAVHYYENDPVFREVTLNPFNAVYIKQLLSAIEIPRIDDQKSGESGPGVGDGSDPKNCPSLPIERRQPTSKTPRKEESSVELLHRYRNEYAEQGNEENITP